MDKITAVGLDLAKQIIQVHAIDTAGRVVLRKTVRRERLLGLLAQLPRCVVGMEACSGAHHWARELVKLGHAPRIMAAEFVRPFRKSLATKNDANDAEAVCTAVVQPNMRWVTIKSVEQQALLSLHRVRQGWIEERTATINRLRGVLAEFGVVLPQAAPTLQRALPALLADEDRLPARVRRRVEVLCSHLRDLDTRLAAFDRDLAQHAKQSEPSAHAADPGRSLNPASGTAPRTRKTRSDQRLDRAIGAAGRLSQDVGGDCEQACTHHLGPARAR
jgi:transposase